MTLRQPEILSTQTESKQRARNILKVLSVCLTASTAASIMKIAYGHHVDNLAIVADGVHSIADSAGTLLGMISVVLSSRPPDDGHPYGHRKFELVSSIALSLFLMTAAYEVGHLAFQKTFGAKAALSHADPWGFLIIATSILISWTISKYETRAAKNLHSSFIEADALHNKGDFFISFGVLISYSLSFFSIPYADGIISLLIATYLTFLSIRLLVDNLKPLVDSSVLNPTEVKDIVTSVPGVLFCHAVRSRGDKGYHFLDLNIHLKGTMTLFEAHQITHEVEHKLKDTFPGLVDVVIHTEPDNHPPCSKNDRC